MSRHFTSNRNQRHPFEQHSPTVAIGRFHAEATKAAECFGSAVLPMDPPANDPVVSNDEAIRRYVDSQPAQLYRGGA